MFDIERGDKPYMFEYLARAEKGSELLTLSASSAEEKRRWMEGIASHTKTEIRPSESESFYDWPENLLQNSEMFSPEERYLISLLLRNGQHHLFSHWTPPGQNDELKHAFLAQVKSLHESYMPDQGGLEAYINNAKKLLADSKNGLNPLDGWRPEVPEGISITPISREYESYDTLGINDVGYVGFVLVAGGLGERLGYNGIKISLPTETTTNTCYIELYCKEILAIQEKYSARNSAGAVLHPIPLAIMVSEDTCVKTEELLRRCRNFGMLDSQITILKQGKVPALLDNDAHLALDEENPYLIAAKPHGHGDVHALMHSSGTAVKWWKAGVKWCYFFQDTNGLAMYSLAATLGVSMKLSLEVNSRSVPRFAKQAVGGIARLVHQDSGRVMTINVEYNQLDPLLRSTISPEGDVNDPTTGRSMFPGNINQLLFRMEENKNVLVATSGVMGEFVNPKYTDSTKTTFKKPTRLECMMQDYPKVLGASARVGFTGSPGWSCYSPVKNSTVDAAASVAKGVPAGCAMVGESDQYLYWAHLLNRMGASVAIGPEVTACGITCSVSPQIVFRPNFVIFPVEMAEKFPSPENISISDRSCLVVEGNVIIESLALDGALHISNKSTVIPLVIRCDLSAPVVNAGQKVSVIEPDDLHAFPEVIRMRGFEIRKIERLVIDMAKEVKERVILTEVEILSGNSGIDGVTIMQHGA